MRLDRGPRRLASPPCRPALRYGAGGAISVSAIHHTDKAESLVGLALVHYRLGRRMAVFCRRAADTACRPDMYGVEARREAATAAREYGELAYFELSLVEEMAERLERMSPRPDGALASCRGLEDQLIDPVHGTIELRRRAGECTAGAVAEVDEDEEGEDEEEGRPDGRTGET